MNKQLSLAEALSYFDLVPGDMPDLSLQNMGIDEANKRVKEFKLRLKKAYRQVVFKYHPDHGGDMEKMKIINSIYTSFMQLKVIVRPVSPPPVFVYTYHNAYSGATTSSSTSTLYSTYY